MRVKELIPDAIPYMIGDQIVAPPGVSTHVFGGDAGISKTESILKLGEIELVNWIINDPQKRKLFFDEYFPTVKNPNYVIGKLRRKLIEGYSGGGDFDIILIDGEDYTRAISIEFKRITINKVRDGTETLKRFDNINELKKQGEERIKFKFYKVFLIAAIEVDRTELRDALSLNPQPFNVSVNKLDRFYDKNFLKSIPDELGFGIVEACQYSHKSIKTTFAFGAKVFKEGKLREQDPILSEAIKKSFKIIEK